MKKLRKLKPHRGDRNTNEPVTNAEQGDGQPISLKPKFEKPKLVPHGDLVDVTGPFGGTLTP